jgi:ankyrin repeat protein
LQGNLKFLKRLHKAGANFNSVDQLGRAPIHVLADGKSNVEVVKYIINNNINLDLPDPEGCSALYIAIEGQNWEIAELLCHEGATVIAD